MAPIISSVILTILLRISELGNWDFTNHHNIIDAFLTTTKDTVSFLPQTTNVGVKHVKRHTEEAN